MSDGDIDQIIVSNKISYKKAYKYFIGYFIILPQMRARTNSFGKTKCLSFLIEDAKLLGKYNKIWDKVSNSIKDISIANLKPMKNL